ncbi:MAG: adenylyltransferase/cytidyltransferase family protein, partial [Candidatus Methanofastidiosia archaeon]
MPKLKIIASGTFDRLHEGHKYFLREAFKIGFPFIAITADEMLSEKEFSELIHPYKKRRSELV